MNSFLITGFLISILNIAISFVVKRFVPRKINGFVGYRTLRSMRSQEAWDFANHYFADLMFKCSLVTFVLQFIFYLILPGEIGLLCYAGLWVASPIFIMIRTEVMLKRHGF